MMMGMAVALDLWGAAAAGLTLYSYTDAGGRMVVVDSLEKVPPEFRDRVRGGKIRPFEASDPQWKGSPPGAPGVSPQLEAVPDEMPSPTPTPTSDSSSELQLQAPPPEIALATEPAWEIASRWLANLGQIQDLGEKLWVIARGVSPTDPRVHFLRTEALQRLEGMRTDETLTWDRAAEWVTQARALTGRYRIIFWNVSRWLEAGGKALATDLPPLLIQTRQVLEHLRQTLPAPLMLEVPAASETHRSR